MGAYESVSQIAMSLGINKNTDPSSIKWRQFVAIVGAGVAAEWFYKKTK